ncbi:hypothetical protein [Maledivibacter halophilus]|uniref:Uncharacterized protein n=1 Tax=Maledivibacter halophilus TaxID=36842 RepID=A0A1T5JRZ8_9FIRM|nr:hypothetical protein [Maledivibacter halophilus]SKC54133.1 hypothetical protein SAMN02194393_01279 [Maledivibacter halophilus]
MYRIVCESYLNYIRDFDGKDKNDFRYQIMIPFELLLDLEKYKIEKKNKTLKYKKLEDFIWFMKKAIKDYPNFKSFLWTVESRGIKGKYYGVSSDEELREQIKIMNMFLKLVYWN